MSGGVDSSVAALLLQRAGYDVVGCFMRLGSPGEAAVEMVEAGAGGAGVCKPVKIGHQGCCSINDAQDARLVAAKLGIPFYVCNFKREFGRIIDYFVGEYAAGRTPNPCVRCNDWLKFGKLHEYAEQIGAGFVATGHYARVEAGPGDTQPSGPRLMRGIDTGKDQSYVLFGITAERLARTLLPIGGMHKADVRALAQREGLPVFNKPDSQEICFVPDNDYAGLVEGRRPELRVEGAVLDREGRTVGTHPGQHHFTIGQRRGVGLALGHPVYVVRKDAERNTITIGGAGDLLASGCVAGEANWHPAAGFGAEQGSWRRCFAQFRSKGRGVRARVRLGAGDGRFEVRFDEPQSAVAPGQAVVLYDGAEPAVVWGGGWIERVVGAGEDCPD
jgi:tRNA-specific 2-thiouridylase